MTKQEKTRLLSLSLVRKYDLYAQQNNATVAACVGEYIEATQEPDVVESTIEEVIEETVEETLPEISEQPPVDEV